MLELAFVDPIALQVGPFAVRWYGIIFVSAIIAALLSAMRASRHRGLDPEFIPDISMVIVPAGILGARLYEVFVLQWEYYRHRPGEILAIWEGGLAIHGGVMLAVAAGYVYTRYRKQPFWQWADMIGPGLILAQGIGRWGNFFNQEAFGRPASEAVINLMPGWLRDGMTIGGTVMHPTFLYESAWNVASFALLWAYMRKAPPFGAVFGLYLILYNAGRFLIESIREDSSFVFGTIRVAQLTSVLLLLAGVALLVWSYRRARTARI